MAVIARADRPPGAKSGGRLFRRQHPLQHRHAAAFLRPFTLRLAGDEVKQGREFALAVGMGGFDRHRRLLRWHDAAGAAVFQRLAQILPG